LGPPRNHIQSGLETTGGFNDGGQCLHLRATGRGDNGANKVRATLAAGLSANQTATIRAKVRWLKGFPEILLRLKGGYLEATGP